MKAQRHSHRIARHRLALGLVGAAGLAMSGTAAGNAADIEVEAARQFVEMKASMPLITDRETIDYIACVANAVVMILEPPYSDLQWEMAIFEVDAVNAFAMRAARSVSWRAFCARPRTSISWQRSSAMKLRM